MIDIHAHILPGIDDGPGSLVDCVAIVRELAEQGVTDIIATPHYVADTIYNSTRFQNSKLLKELQKALNTEGIGVNVYLGNEIYIDKDILEFLKKRKISALNDSKYLLIELPMDGEFPNYEDYFLELLNKGYKVVLAHPERYAIVNEDFDVVRNLYEMGVLLQCNLGSITGKYGRSVKKTIKKIAKEKMIFAFGSDIHHLEGPDFVRSAQKKLSKIYSEKELKRLLVDNPSKILATR